MNAIARHWDAARDALAEEKLQRRIGLRVSETDFLPAALEIIEKPVSPTGRITAWILLGGLATALGWLTFGHVDIVASAPGRLIPADNVKLIQPAEPGIVRAIAVRDGQHVRAGQVLVELDPTISTAEAVQAEKALEKAQLDAARLRAVLGALDGGGLVFHAPPGTPPEVARTQVSLARAQLDDVRASAYTHRADGASAAAARSEAMIQAAKLTETLPLLDQQIAANEALLEKGYVAKLKVIEMRRQRLVAARDRDAALATARKASAQIDVSSGNMAQSAAEVRAKILADLAQAESEARQRHEELTKASQRSRLQRLASPVDGTVTQLAIHTLGGVVEATKPVMVVVPSGGTLVAEVKILNRDIGFARVGQPVAVKLEAFPFTRYGTIPGRLLQIGSDASEDEKLGLIYTARVALMRSTILRDGSEVRLSPGMSATADIRTGSRSLLSYLLSPIDKASKEAGRER